MSDCGPLKYPEPTPITETYVCKSDLAWSSEIPTQPGWYWWRPAPGHTKCIVLLSGGLIYSVLVIGHAYTWVGDDWPCGGEWQRVKEPDESS